jgi:hypothetical protein
MTGDAWDYMSQYSPGTNEYRNARTFGNFAFGAVMASLNLTYREAQNVADVAQTLICTFGGACGEGFPLLQFPYGDQEQPDAAEIRGGDTLRTARFTPLLPRRNNNLAL